SAGTGVPAGSAVNLVISSGPQGVSVPNVVGQAQSAAQTAITGVGLTVGTITTAPSTTVAAGNVISGLSQKFLDIFIVPVQLLPVVELREVPHHLRLVLIAALRPGKHLMA